MIRHIVAWNYKDGFSEAEKKQNSQSIKDELEALAQLIDGIVELRVNIEILPSGNRDIVLNSLFESKEALEAYQIHPEHKRIGAFIGSVTQDRVCVDYYE